MGSGKGTAIESPSPVNSVATLIPFSWFSKNLQQRLVKTGGRLVKHARYYWLLLAESHPTRRLFASMLGRTVDCRFRRDSSRRQHPKNDSDIPQEWRGV